MEQRTSEWLEQSDYDMDSANYMYEGGRHIYAVFMCHLSIEKALKGFFYEKHRSIPPKSHNLIYLFNQIGIKPPLEHGKFIVKINEASILTRYPENINKLSKLYNKAVVKDILDSGREVVSWIKRQL